MSTSTLTPENLPAGPDRRLKQGHGTAALGPSDSSDSGSDVRGADELLDDIADAELGDSELDSDTDREGTGERGAAGREPATREGADIDTDHVERIAPDFDDEEEI